MNRKVKINDNNFKGIGIFHQWVALIDENGESDTYAIVESESGHVTQVYYQNIQFIDPLINKDFEDK